MFALGPVVKPLKSHRNHKIAIFFFNISLILLNKIIVEYFSLQFFNLILAIYAFYFQENFRISCSHFVTE